MHRHCWRKHRRQSAMGNDMISDKSTDPLAEKNHDEVSHKVLKENKTTFFIFKVMREETL